MPKTQDPSQPAPGDTSSTKGNGGAGAPRPETLRAGTVPQADSTSAEPAGRGTPRGHPVSERKGQFLIAARKPQGMMPMGFMPLQFSVVEQILRASPDIDVIDTVGPRNVVGMLADGLGDAPGVLVARMTEQKAGILAQQGQGRLIVERDQPLTLSDLAFQPPPLVSGFTTAAAPVLATVIVVLGKDGAPVKDAEVYLFGSMLPATGTTDAEGKVTLSLFGETPQSIRGLYVKPRSDYWSFYQQQPEISADEANIVGLRALSDWPSLANFPGQQAFTWGQKAMRLDQLPGNFRGAGIKVAVVDSGADNGHGDLQAIRRGLDVIGKKTTPDAWNVDSIAHGSHCAGVIAGADNAVGVRGFAPDAEIHACKLFPGGQVSQLIDALEYCIENQIDVVNLSLGGAEPSEALEQQIARARRAGVACIVAAGNSGNRVQYPASSPNVLAVSAIGKLNEFPPDSYHTQTITQMMDPNGFFAAKFSCFGPEIAVCGPGVAITSSVPPGNYAAWDGTSMAAPHISGLAALVLAHHPDFQGPYKARTAERVERLFQIIKSSCRRLNVGDASRTGFGLPDALAATGLQPTAEAMAGAGRGASPAAPSNAALMSMQAGGNIGGFGAPAMGTASLAPYLEALQSTPAWWSLAGQPGSGLSIQGFDPYAAYVAACYGGQQATHAMPAYGYMQPQASGFGRQGW